MATLNPKEFIQAVFINDLSGIMAIDKPYISFMVMAIGIEFLGKCISLSQEWDEERVSRMRFEEAIKNIPALHSYIPLLKENNNYDLYVSLRCGLAHAAKPKYEITLSSKNERAHLVTQDGRVNLKCEDFFADFVAACREVIAMNFSSNEDKMNKPFLAVPAISSNQTGTNPGSTLIGPMNIFNSSRGV